MNHAEGGSLCLLRHGESLWNKKNLFTGWVDVPLSLEGIEEAAKAGKQLASRPFPIDVVFTSSLVRAMMTAQIALAQYEGSKVPVVVHPSEGAFADRYKPSNDASQELIFVHSAWQLNERYYGDLQGLDKQDIIDRFGAQQVQLWRRSFAEEPPHGESLEATAARVHRFFQEKIVPLVQLGHCVLVVAHHNSLRSLIMHLEGLSQDEIAQKSMATGEPFIYHLREHRWILETE